MEEEEEEMSEEEVDEEMSEEEVVERIEEIRIQLVENRCQILRAEFKRDEMLDNYNRVMEEIEKENKELRKEMASLFHPPPPAQ